MEIGRLTVQVSSKAVKFAVESEECSSVLCWEVRYPSGFQ